MIHYYKTHWVLFAKVNARISIKSYKIAITFANNRTAVESLNVAMATAIVCSEFRRRV